MILNSKQVQELEEAAKPLAAFLRENCHPHMTVIVTGESAELVEGLATVMLTPVSEPSSSGNDS